MKKRATFIDRDGTLIKEVEYLSDPKLLELLPNVEKGLSLLKTSNLLNVIITNQSAIGRGFITAQRLEEIHLELTSTLIQKGVKIDAIYYCPHKPEDRCECRKPGNKMLLQAAKDHSIDLTKSYVIGDRLMDVLMGKSVGAKTIIIPSKWTSLDGDHQKFDADYTCKDLFEAALWVQKNI